MGWFIMAIVLIALVVLAFYRQSEKSKKNPGEQECTPAQEAAPKIKVEKVELPGLTNIHAYEDLTPGQVLLLHYAPTFSVQRKDYPMYWSRYYNIENVGNELKILSSGGYIKVGEQRSTLDKQKVDALKAALKEYDLPVSGKKSELVERLQKNVPDAELLEKFSDSFYELTEKGKGAVKATPWLIYVHKCKYLHPEINIYTVTKLMQEPPDFPYRDKIWGELNRIALDTESYRNTRWSMYNFRKEEDPKSAFPFLCDVIYCDLNDSYGKEVMIPPGILQELKAAYPHEYKSYEEAKADWMNNFSCCKCPTRPRRSREKCAEAMAALLTS